VVLAIPIKDEGFQQCNAARLIEQPGSTGDLPEAARKGPCVS
jgi:hypothetical protein